LVEAIKFFYEMSNRNIGPDVVTYNTLIDVLCKEGKLDEARKLFDEMSDRNIGPDVVTCNAL